ncbi:hypothetical protein PUN28_002055 [Cardiocondyla obscurior]|uniref:Uncharacterized protein n=1 Tax=Cardiocondyla obscurior TaxID=286306 RepID=A0AAW2GSC6_9HYME
MLRSEIDTYLYAKIFFERQIKHKMMNQCIFEENICGSVCVSYCKKMKRECLLFSAACNKLCARRSFAR